MRALAAWCNGVSSWRTLLLATVVYALFIAAVMAPQGERMLALAGAWGAPDGHLFYTPDELYRAIGNWSAAAKGTYVNFRLTLDPLWAFTYGGFLVIAISLALRAQRAPLPTRLNLVPLVPMLADLTENLLGIALVTALPARLDWLAWLTAGVTAGKWTSLTAAHLLLAGLLLRAGMQRLRGC